MNSSSKLTATQSEMNKQTPALVLLRGLGRGKNHWGEFIPLLEEAFPNRAIITIDLPGNGELFQQKSPRTLNRAIKQLNKQLNDYVNDEPVDVIALSLGGMISLEMKINSRRINKLCVINTSHAGLSKTLERMHPATGLKLLFSIATDIPKREAIIWKLTSNLAPIDEVLEDWIEEAELHPVTIKNLLRQLHLARSFKSDLSQITDPENLLVCYSDNDLMVNPSCSKRIIEVTGATAISHPSAGHDIPLDDPTWLIKELKKFF